MTDSGHSTFGHPNLSEPISRFAKIAALSLAYFLAAKLGLMLAVPPGYASPVFPASGIALAGLLTLGYRSWPGVFLGSMMLNLSVSVDPATSSSAWDTLLLVSGIGGGAALQAVTGAYLVRRFSAFPLAFSDWRKVVTFLFWGGPASCLINAVIGVSVLRAAGRIPAENFLYNSASWWIGDTFGVLIFTPLLLMWALPRDRMALSRRVTATVPAAITFVLAVILAWYATAWERARIQHQFNRQATFLSLAFEKSLYGHMVAITSLRSFVSTIGELDQPGFREFAQGVLANNRGIRALSWNPIVRKEERAAFEADVRRSGRRQFHITERSGTGQLRRADERAEHVVVRFIEPIDGNESAVGYDVASDPTRGEALRFAKDSGRPIATAPIDLVQEKGQQAGVLLFVPVYASKPLPANLAHRRRALRGYVVGVLHMGDVVEHALGNLETNGIVFRLVDDAAPADRRLLYESEESAVGVPILRDEGLLGGSNALIYKHEHEFGGRQWSLQHSPTQQYVAKHRPENAWMILSGGLLIAGLVVAFTVVLVGREDALTALIDELTAAKAEAVRANEAKSDFLAAMSHDLRTPLNAILGFSEVMKNRMFGNLGDPRYEAYARDIHHSGEFLLSLINDVLDTSKIEAGKYQLSDEVVNVPQLIGDCVHMISPMAEQAKISLITDIADDIAPLRCDCRVVAQTLNNLLSNAVKFSREGGEVRVSAMAESGAALKVKISDTGIGFSEGEKIRAFEPFRQTRRMHAKQGTGLGLYLCVRFMELHGGTLDIRSKKGKGTTVAISFPPERAMLARHPLA